MIPHEPPRWLQRVLLRFLNARDRETISGDLLEEYLEERLPQTGAERANYWYFRQVISLMTVQITKGPILKQTLILASFFILAAGVWLGVMEQILKHDGYQNRLIIAFGIAAQGLATLLFLRLGGSAGWRYLIMAGAVASLFIGGSAINTILRATHFEGFVLVIGLALVAQGTLTLLTLLRSRPRPR